jgi:Icc-related predicted phosphoesterase
VQPGGRDEIAAIGPKAHGDPLRGGTDALDMGPAHRQNTGQRFPREIPGRGCQFGSVHPAVLPGTFARPHPYSLIMAPDFGGVTEGGCPLIVLAQISDTHFDGGERNRSRAAQVMAYLNGLPNQVDAILVTGDVANSGRASEYDEARAVLTASVPVFFGPGNHDDRAAFRSTLLGEPTSAAPLNAVRHVGGTAIVMLDSTVPGQPYGELSAATLDWLRATLRAQPADARILLAFHHPPVRHLGSLIDAINLRDPDQLADIVRSEARIAGAVCGHAHMSAVTTFAGRPLAIAPSTHFAVGPDWEHPPSVPQMIDMTTPPALAFHVIGDGPLITHFRTVMPGVVNAFEPSKQG